jgi:hypothetical protein
MGEATAARRATVLAAAIPVLGLLALIVRAEVKVRTGAGWLLGIEGYDPRDLLSGHFLRYQYSFAWEGPGTCGEAPPGDEAAAWPRGERSPPPPSAAGCCVCLRRRGEGLVEPGAELVACDEIEDRRCDGALRADDVIGPQKYFVPEDRAAALERALRGRKAAVSVALPPGSAPAVKELYLDGKPWREALPDGG